MASAERLIGVKVDGPVEVEVVMASGTMALYMLRKLLTMTRLDLHIYYFVSVIELSFLLQILML